MAEDPNVRRIFQVVSKQRESPALFLLQSIVDEWRTNRASYDGPGHLMRKCLHQAAVSNQGLEALQIHMVLFRHLFVENELAAPDQVLELGFSASDYFQLLRDEKLGWLSFLTKVVPYMRLEESNSFLGKLAQCLSRSDGTPQCVADVRLLVFAVSLVHSIVQDFLLAEHRAADGEVADATSALSSLDKPLGKLSTSAQLLAANLATSFQSLLQICRSNQLLGATLQEPDLFKQLVEILILTAIVLNPYLTTEDKKAILLDFYSGQVIALNQTASWKKEKKNGRRFSIIDTFRWTEIRLQESASKLKTNDHEGSNEGNASSDVKTRFCAFKFLIENFHSQTLLTLYFELISFFCEKSAGKDEDFCMLLSDVLLDGEDLYVGYHVLSCQKLYSWFLEHLQNVVQGKLVLNEEIRNVSESQTLTECLAPYKKCDVSALKMTKIDRILKMKTVLCEKDDLDLVKEAVAHKTNGWRGVLELGLSNTDLSGWWRSGFFQLVWDNEATLSTKKNVKQMLKVLAHVSLECDKPEDADFRVAVYRLFCIMFKRLPVLLQEQIVFSILAPSTSEGDNLDTSGFYRLLSKEEVCQQLTPLLNKLTSAGIDKMMGQILFLCLFDANLVMQQAVSVAMENKAQVLPVVEVLRQMSCICLIPERKFQQPKLLVCLHEILSGIEMDNNKADNIVQMLRLLTKTYNLNINIDNQIHIIKEMPPLLPQSVIFEQFICPALSQEMSRWSNAAPSEDVQKGTSFDPKNQTQDVGRGLDQVSGGKAEPEGSAEFRDSEEMAGCKQTINCDDVKEDGVVASKLPLDVALRVLSALLEEVETVDIQALKLFPLLVALADVYAKNFVVLEGDRLDKTRLLVKQGCLKNIVLVTSAVSAHSRIFTKADFLWLKKQALRYWLCVAVLKPVLNIGCDVELHDVLCSFTRQLVLQGSGQCSIKALVMLLQLALVNDEMLGDLMSVIKQCQLSTSHNQLVLAVREVLAVSLPSEMYRLVKIILVFLANQDQPFPVDSGLLVSESPTGCGRCDQHQHFSAAVEVLDVQLHVQASQLLTDAVLQLSIMELPVESSCHIVSNYQAALQALLQHEVRAFYFLVDLFCHCCSVLSVVTDQPSQILQVSAMNLLMKMKTFFSRKSKATDEIKAEDVRLEYARGVASIEDYIECVNEDSVKQILMTQLMNVL